MQHVHLILARPQGDSLNRHLGSVVSEIVTELGSSHTTLFQTDIYALYEAQHPTILPHGAALDEAQKTLVEEEQAKIKAASLMIIQFPLYWFSFPGLLKNYWDQVLTPGFAYPGKFEESPLADGRRVLLSTTTQSLESDFSEQGSNGPIDAILHPLTVAFRFVGYKILKPHAIYGVHNQSEAQISEAITTYRTDLKALIEKGS